ncbi:mannose-1-phosphate guanylyltransferase/mannose-6-phosphate isomerase [Labrys wisconsinensis]|uniref:mannose-1-phosphate guanylyltransferase n=1 Tax=Labrys wisconsinensis TaxID=425677 RepID=A0ABU0J1R5_9HYPH|nr:mannose-1-phosphate guanylyltransferase/mannose-6-phosphate isomerase [Labrys wisconsinensis]MDQ0467264.1 mannose-1-phosphate guanylyltransferase/mannose-6-phosphate isomerase [Labrys wisconsinensis]
MNIIVPLIVCGGSGTRLWPSSRASRPKQFLPLFGDFSTFQETLRRASAQGLFGRPVIVTNRDHRFLVDEQLGGIGMEADVLLEPEARDSGPAILAGARFIAERDGDSAVALSLAADHMVRDVGAFVASCRTALAVAQAGHIATFGITPDHPATGFGYIEPGDVLSHGGFLVKRFVEKPDAETAARYLREGFYWNAGNFMFQAGVLCREYETFEPATATAVAAAVVGAVRDRHVLHIDAEAFAGAGKRSIDYAVMEKTRRIAVVPATFDWSDVGSWSAVRDLTEQDETGNAARGKAVFIDARSNFVSTDGPLVAVVGLDDLAVIATDDAIMVTRREDSAGVKALVETLKASHAHLTLEHRQALRPWGSFRSLDQGARHQVKSIVVKPGERLSLQKHHHRSEHWIVVRGTATVTIGGQVKTVHENESVFIPAGAVHRLENPGKIELEVIEVQNGSYLGEDDIIRIEDVYNRAAS